MTANNVDAVQDQIDVLVNQLFGLTNPPPFGGQTGKAIDAAVHR